MSGLISYVQVVSCPFATTDSQSASVNMKARVDCKIKSKTELNTLKQKIWLYIASCLIPKCQMPIKIGWISKKKVNLYLLDNKYIEIIWLNWEEDCLGASFFSRAQGIVRGISSFGFLLICLVNGFRELARCLPAQIAPTSIDMPRCMETWLALKKKKRGRWI